MEQSASFSDYIEKRFDDEIFNAVADYVDECVQNNQFNKLDIRTDRLKRMGEVSLETITVKGMDIYSLPGMIVGFDIRVEADFEITEGDYHYDDAIYPKQWFQLSGKADLSKNLDDFKLDDYVEVYNQKNRHNEHLSDSLVPIMRHEDYEKYAEKFLRHVYPEGLSEDCSYVDPMEVAKSMGLTVLTRHITEDCSVFGQVYFRDCDTEMFNEDAGMMEPVHIEAGTIVVDPDTYFMYNLGKVNNTIIHECVHWFYHRKAFELERILSGDELSMIGCKVVGGVKGHSSSDVSRIESQANALAPRIQMPYKAFKARASYWICEFRKESETHELMEVLPAVIDMLAAEFHVSRLAAKIRMVEVGYEEAVGTFNYVDGRYVKPYRLKKGSLKLNQTVTIGSETLLRQLIMDPVLRDTLRNREYTYVDGFLVRFDSRYLQYDENGTLVMSEYALSSVNECCVIFDMQIEGKVDDEYHTICFLDRDENPKFNIQLICNDSALKLNDKARSEYLEELLQDAAIVISNMGDNYLTNLNAAFDWSCKWYEKDYGKKLTKQDVAKDLNLTEDYIVRIFKGKKVPALEVLADICIVLRLPPEMSIKICTSSPKGLNLNDEVDRWYYSVFWTMAGQSLDKIHEFMKSKGKNFDFYKLERSSY